MLNPVKTQLLTWVHLKDDLPTFFAQKFIGVLGDDSRAVEITLHMDHFGASWLESTLDLEKFNSTK